MDQDIDKLTVTAYRASLTTWMMRRCAKRGQNLIHSRQFVACFFWTGSSLEEFLVFVLTIKVVACSFITARDINSQDINLHVLYCTGVFYVSSVFYVTSVFYVWFYALAFVFCIKLLLSYLIVLITIRYRVDWRAGVTTDATAVITRHTSRWRGLLRPPIHFDRLTVIKKTG